MKIGVVQEKVEHIKSDLIINFFFENTEYLNEEIKPLDELLNGKISKILKMGDFKGSLKDQTMVYTDGAFKTERILLCGLGEKEKFTLNTLRKAAGKAVKDAKKRKFIKIAIDVSIVTLYKEMLNIDESVIIQAIAEGTLLSQYKFKKYIHQDEKNKDVDFKEIIFFTDEKNNLSTLRKSIEETQIICHSVRVARDLINAPSNEINPITFSDRAKEIARKSGMKITILKKKDIETKKMGGLLAVSQGSLIPPRFVILEYNIDKLEYDTIVLVGKGITFDSGGISLKPSSDMWTMKMDMSGAAAVIGTLEAAANLKLPVRLIGLIPLAENLPSGSSQKPGDIITVSNGKTVEVDNTDAEGRLILADALVYANKYNPKAIIDLATLTGACVVALGQITTGMMGNNKNLMEKLSISGQNTYERVWELPLFEEYDELIKSDYADVKNVGGKWGGAITAAMFLKRFVGDFPWVHLDIAGTAMLDKETDYEPKGGTGVGVRLLIDFLRNWNK